MVNSGIPNPRILIWGGNGWIAQQMFDLIKSHQGDEDVFMTTVRMEDRAAVEKVIDEIKPTHVLNCAGCTGRPNVDWCEDNKGATIRSNVIGTLNIADICDQKRIHLTVFATGCIYQYDKDHQPGGKGYTEEDPANFQGSFYSYTKSRVEDIMKHYPNTLILRLRMPVSDDLHPRNFVTKITKYEHVVNIPNSMTILHDLLPAAYLMAVAREEGVYNFTNPGAISHNEVLALFRDIIRPDFRWKNFTEDEQAKVIKAGRSNCELDTSKLGETLARYGMIIPEIHEAFEACFRRMKEKGVVDERELATTA